MFCRSVGWGGRLGATSHEPCFHGFKMAGFFAEVDFSVGAHFLAVFQS